MTPTITFILQSIQVQVFLPITYNNQFGVFAQAAAVSLRCLQNKSFTALQLFKVQPFDLYEGASLQTEAKMFEYKHRKL